jgi:hypothetical protein
MTHLSKLSFAKISRKEVVTPVQRKRLNLLQKLDLQIEAATAELKDEQFLEEITKWVRGEDGTKQAVIQQRPIRKWWWQHHSGAWMVTLKDGTKELPLGDGNTAIAIGDLDNLVDVLTTVREAVMSGEFDLLLQSAIQAKPKAVRAAKAKA